MRTWPGSSAAPAQTFNVTSTTSGFVPGATNLRNFTHNTYAGYVQDKWKVLPNLTINMGVRYEYWTPLNETNGLYLAPRLENGDVKATAARPQRGTGFHRRPLRTPVLQGRQEQLRAEHRLRLGSVQGRQDLHPRRLHDRVCERQRGNGRPQQRGHQQRAAVREHAVEPHLDTRGGAHGSGAGLQSAAHAGRQLRHHHDLGHRHARSQPGDAVRAAVDPGYPARNQRHDRVGSLRRQPRQRLAAGARLQPGALQRQRLPGRLPAGAEQRRAVAGR